MKSSTAGACTNLSYYLAKEIITNWFRNVETAAEWFEDVILGFGIHHYYGAISLE